MAACSFEGLHSACCLAQPRVKANWHLRHIETGGGRWRETTAVMVVTGANSDSADWDVTIRAVLHQYQAAAPGRVCALLLTAQPRPIS